jgi:SagB-type dehydrogenase family enzyme
VLSWREGVTASAAGEGALLVQGPSGQVSLRRVAPLLLDALGQLDYDPARQRLTRLCGRTAEGGGLLRDAAESTAIPEDNLQVLLILAASFPRLAWKYESIAYALTLKHVGVVFQTMYLAATAMGLAPRAIGEVDADLFVRAAGTDHRAETSVGEFLLGSQRSGLVAPIR